MAATTCCLVRPDTYRDSVELMRVAAEIEKLPGVSRAALMMATPANRELLEGAGLLDGRGAAAGPNDLVVAVAAADPAAITALTASPASASSARLAGVAIISAARATPGRRSSSAARRISSTESRYVSRRTRHRTADCVTAPPSWEPDAPPFQPLTREWLTL